MVDVRLDEFASQQIASGYPIHEHQGVWWQRTAPFFHKPVFPFQVLTPGSARPSRLRSVLGYSHVCDDAAEATRAWSMQVMDRETLAGFDVANLIYAKRKNLKRALATLTFSRLDDLEPLLPELQQVCISQATRARHGKPPEYYVDHHDEWRRYMLREFASPHREWWGAFHEGRLAAYVYAYEVEGVMVFGAFKSHTDFFPMRPNDGIVYTFLQHCRSLGTVDRIIFGDWSPDDTNLNAFKESFLFHRVDIPVYAVYHPAVRVLRRLR